MELYAKGEGIAQNNREAFFWFSVCAADGFLLAVPQRNAIESRLTRDEWHMLVKRIETWVPEQAPAEKE